MIPLMIWLKRAVVALLFAALGSYLGDAGVFLRRQHFGAPPMDAVKVSGMIAVPLKNGKQEFYSEGSQMVPCSRSLYPQSGYKPCWYLRRHAQDVQQY